VEKMFQVFIHIKKGGSVKGVGEAGRGTPNKTITKNVQNSWKVLRAPIYKRGLRRTCKIPGKLVEFAREDICKKAMILLLHL